jgi:hypothetical protein
MIARQIRKQPLFWTRHVNISDRANEADGHRFLQGPSSWFLAERALPELKYVATNNGYVLLP